jgi:hypothetical protein
MHWRPSGRTICGFCESLYARIEWIDALSRGTSLLRTLAHESLKLASLNDEFKQCLELAMKNERNVRVFQLPFICRLLYAREKRKKLHSDSYIRN